MGSPIKQYDIVVAGNGVLAYSTVFRLVRDNPDLSVAIVGPSARPGCASKAAGAMLASFAEIDSETFRSEPSSFKFRMSREATSMWPAWVEEINACARNVRFGINFGTYVLHNAKADEMDDIAYRHVIAALKRNSEPYEEPEPSEIPGILPVPEARPLKAIYIPGEGSFPSEQLFFALESYLHGHPRVEIIDAEARDIKLGSNEMKELETDDGRKFISKKILIAAGANSLRLLDQIPALAERMPKMFYGVGCGLILKTQGHVPPKTVRTLNRGLACGIHMVPYDENVCYVGASNFICKEPEYSPRASSLFLLLQAAMEQIHRMFYKAQVVRYVVGHRPTTVDTFPLIGETSLSGIFILSGTKRDGIHLSPLLAQILAREIQGDKSYRHPFSPERRPIRTMTKEEGILKAIAHMKSAAIQHELRLPKSGWEERIDRMLRKHVEEIYERCRISDFGIPPEMLDMYKYGHADGAAPDGWPR